MLRRALCRFTLGLALCLIGFAPGASRAEGLALIRDAEIERLVRSYATPIFAAAGLNEDAVRIYLVNSPEINAFVAGGAKMFLHTGLIVRSDTPEMLIGVIAHEAGHIAGGHLVRSRDQMEQAMATSVIGMLVGGAAAASGAADIGSAIMSAGNQVAQRQFLAYTRAQEEAADQAALAYLRDAGISPRGLLDMFELLRSEQVLKLGEINPYTVTHPLGKKRIAHVRSTVENSDLHALGGETLRRHRRMLAKLRGFLDPPQHTFTTYEGSEAEDARYARAIAYFKLADLEQALELIDGLIAEHPDDPFYHEIKGQMLFENGRIADAIAPYEQAHALLPEAPLITLGLASALLASEDPTVLQRSIDLLEQALTLDKTLPGGYRQLAVAYGRNGEIGRSHLALVEQALLRKDKDETEAQLRLALARLEQGSIGWQRAKDIELLLKTNSDALFPKQN